MALKKSSHSIGASDPVRLDTPPLQDVADCGVRNLVTNISQHTLEVIIAPTWIFPGHLEHEFYQFW